MSTAPTASPIRAALARTIALARGRAGYPARTLSREIGKNASLLRDVELGKSGVSLESLVKIGDAVGVPAWKLLRHAQRSMASATDDVGGKTA